MRLEEILDTAKLQITDVKAKQHGDAKESFVFIAKLWSAYLGITISADDVGQLMSLLKIGRSKFGDYNVDDYVDSIGYQALAAWLKKLKIEGPM